VQAIVSLLDDDGLADLPATTPTTDLGIDEATDSVEPGASDPPADEQAELDAFVDEAIAIIEKARRRDFLERPDVELVDVDTMTRIVLDDLPFNGRSQGTISPVAGGGILFDTSGRSVRPDSGRLELEAGSGTLWYLSEPGARPEPFATGFKHAYAHAPLGDGRWLVTEISDGRLDGVVPPDEVVVAVVGDDFGYPACVGDRTPVVEAGGDDTRCSATPSSVALLEPGSTPTGVAVAPWDPTRAFVALWNRGLVVMVDVDAVGGAVDAVLAAFDRPQHLIADGDRILVTDHAAGTITAVTLSGPG
ncbi:MAG: hypothetical protein ACO3WU_13575, partial [Ilumatobacteraceae bacterium]